MILFLYGADSYRSKKKLDDIRAKFVRDIDPSGLNLAQLDGEEAELEEIRSALSAVPFLAKKRMLVLKDAIASSGKKGGAALAEAFAAVPTETILVVHERVGAAELEDSPAFAKLKGGEFYPEFLQMSAKELEGWIIKEAKARGAVFTKPALAAYLATAGTDSWKIAGELDAMSAAASNGTIDDAVVAEFSHATSEKSVFDFLDAVGTRRRDAAAKLLDALLAQDETEVGLLSRLESHVRGLLVAAELSASGDASKDRLARELGIHPFAAGKILSQSRHFKQPELERLFTWLIDADLKLKRGGWPKPRLALDLFIEKLGSSA